MKHFHQIYFKLISLDMGKTKPSSTNYAIPGPPLSRKEFKQMIRSAQNEPFYSMQTLKEEISKWKAKHLKNIE